MTNPNPSSPPSEEQRQQCMLYLLGELDAEQAAAFERRFQSSTELSDELVRQADLISSLAQTSQLGSAPASTHMRWQIAASILAAIAACFAIMVLGMQPNPPEQDSVASLSTTSATVSEDLLIARAWADSHWIVDASDDFSFNDLAADDALPMAADDSSDIDSTLSWMFIAISANIDSQPSETSNDG